MYTSGALDSLVRTLLARHSNEIGPLPRVVSVPYEPDIIVNNNDNNSPLDYMTHIRHINFGRWITSSFEHLKIEFPSPVLQNYIPQEDFQNTYCLHRICRPINAYSAPEHATPTSITQKSFLKTLTIPVSDFKRYLNVIDRLRDLEYALFILDELFVYPVGVLSANNVNDPSGTEEILRMTKAREEAAMQDLVTFIKKHNQRFKNQIKTASCPVSTMWTTALRVCPQTVQFEIRRLLPMLRTPLSIHRLNLARVVAHASSPTLRMYGRLAFHMTQDLFMNTFATT
ncbi:hypothetical protein BGZ96_000743 [Linnemannia gamsii]|uniref:Uncharacterized protein n=1 Tax=Linnemannia gamsii TaxID=64522 RepID=A0ABQ7JNW4_9FUNG|nr:hypothetical protein BGZ96_000743 [Linnemannia gamsii]